MLTMTAASRVRSFWQPPVAPLPRACWQPVEATRTARALPPPRDNAAASGAANGGTLTKGGTLNIYTWPSYFATKNLNTYKHETGTTINISTYDSEDVLFAKMNSAAGSGFDIVIPSTGWVFLMAQRGMLAKLDHSRLPLHYLNPALLNKPYDPGNQYSIPKDYGSRESYDPVAVGGDQDVARLP